MDENIEVIVRSKVKKLSGGFRISSNVFVALDKAVEELMMKAKRRAELNGRITIFGKDV